jgi:hypothetical protein
MMNKSTIFFKFGIAGRLWDGLAVCRARPRGKAGDAWGVAE